MFTINSISNLLTLYIFKSKEYVNSTLLGLGKIYLVCKSIIKIELSILFMSLYYVYIFIMSQDIVEIYFLSFLLLTTTLVILINITNYWVSNSQLKKFFPILHSIIKYTLFILLIINLVYLIIIMLKFLIIIITSLKKSFLNMDIKKKLKDLKLSWDYSWAKNKGKRPQEGTLFFDLKDNRKNKKKASYLKEKIFQAQRKNLNKKHSSTTFKQKSFNNKRGFNKSINIENNPKFTVRDQLNNVKSEFKAYDNQENKFKKIVVGINKGKEEFYPKESESLFTEYVNLIKILKKHLKYVEKTLSKNKS